MTSTVRTITARLNRSLLRRAETLRREPDRGSHSVEYAIGIGLGAAIIIALYAAYRTGVGEVIEGWVFT